MQIVIDANIIISMCIRPGKPLQLLFNNELEVFAPELLREEFENNLEMIQDKSSLSKHQLHELYLTIQRYITFIPQTDFLHHAKQAKNICPDPKDVIYFALAIQLGCGLWSNEKQLRKQDQIPVFATHELIKNYL